MKRIRLIAIVLLVSAAIMPAPAMADPVACQLHITAQGRMPNGANFDPPRKYDTEVQARAKAIAAWRKDVADKCPNYSSSWWRAREQNVSCEGYAGGVACDARAQPAKLAR